MKKTTMYLSLILLSVSFISCSKIKGKGDMIYESRQLSGFSGISLSMDAEVYFTPDTIYSVRIGAQENILEIIETPIEGNSLVFKYKNGKHVGSHETVVIYVHGPGLQALNISGSGNITSSLVDNDGEINLTISGSGNIHLQGLENHSLTCKISGSGSITVDEGQTDLEDLTISGSGNMNLSNVECDTAYARISGSGSMNIKVTKLLDATISGSGNIRYSGNPVVNTHISGSGRVTRN